MISRSELLKGVTTMKSLCVLTILVFTATASFCSHRIEPSNPPLYEPDDAAQAPKMPLAPQVHPHEDTQPPDVENYDPWNSWSYEESTSDDT